MLLTALEPQKSPSRNGLACGWGLGPGPACCWKRTSSPCREGCQAALLRHAAWQALLLVEARQTLGVQRGCG